MIPAFDVIVIGAGGAGCAAALTASARGLSVAIVMSGDFKGSKTARAQGGIQAAIGEGDSWQTHFEDTMRAGDHAGDPALAQVLSQNAVSTINWLVDQGIEFDRNPDGAFRLQTAGGLSHPRILSCGDQSGNRIIGPLYERVAEADITLLENSPVAKITPMGSSYRLEIDPADAGAAVTLKARSIVFASGGASTRKGGSVGTIELASALGLDIKAAELTQFHPTGVILPKALRGRPAPEGLRAAGALVLNKDMTPIADPLLTRKKLCDAITAACEAGQGVTSDDGVTGVWLDTPKVEDAQGPGYIARHYTSFYEAALKAGTDITQAPILVHPIPHYSLGGIVIDPACATNLPGIFAAGEATWGVHGNDRLMGNSLLEIFVFGQIAGRAAADYVSSNTPQTKEVAADG